MKKVLFVAAVLLLVAGVVMAAWNDPYFKGKPKKNRILVCGEDGAIEDSGVDITTITNIVTITNTVKVLSSSVASISNEVATAVEKKSDKDQANGYAGLDENGRISTNATANIIVVYGGGSAF